MWTPCQKRYRLSQTLAVMAENPPNVSNRLKLLKLYLTTTSSLRMYIYSTNQFRTKQPYIYIMCVCVCVRVRVCVLSDFFLIQRIHYSNSSKVQNHSQISTDKKIMFTSSQLCGAYLPSIGDNSNISNFS